MRKMQLQLELGNHLGIYIKTEENQENLRQSSRIDANSPEN